jgi:hypothetical protein
MRHQARTGLRPRRTRQPSAFFSRAKRNAKSMRMRILAASAYALPSRTWVMVQASVDQNKTTGRAKTLYFPPRLPRARVDFSASRCMHLSDSGITAYSRRRPRARTMLLIMLTLLGFPFLAIALLVPAIILAYLLVVIVLSVVVILDALGW